MAALMACWTAEQMAARLVSMKAGQRADCLVASMASLMVALKAGMLEVYLVDLKAAPLALLVDQMAVRRAFAWAVSMVDLWADQTVPLKVSLLVDL